MNVYRQLVNEGPRPPVRTHHACIRCAAAAHPHSFRCDRCDGAVDAFHDLAAVRSARTTNGASPLRRFAGLLPIGGEQGWLGEGNTPCWESSELAEDLGITRAFLKDESANPTGTTKDRIASVSVAWMLEAGIDEFVLSSTGNTAEAYARAVGLTPGIRMHAFVGREFAERVNRTAEPRVTLHLVDGNYSTATAAAATYARQKGLHAEGGFFNYVRREGVKLAYLEAFDAIPGRVDYIFQAISSGLGLLAAYKGALEYVKLGRLTQVPRIAGVQESTCSPMTNAWDRGATTLGVQHTVTNPVGIAQAILLGDPYASYPYVAEVCTDTGGHLVRVTDKEIREARELVYQWSGADVCNASAAAVAGVRASSRAGRIERESTVLIMLTGRDRPRRSYLPVGGSS